ncbi:hypothetical protein PC116_g27920 [Phytophthora cactorum]|uniref:Uncharacterized protein n=1 Tax=Phytophthora cactorum TaxID=29920 RepID=A0A8T1AFD7_9STRA|nr:hypothetical protein Pcac1_g4165 [Phytophthora cactorum]KAG2792849.1 hypothetical protein PC111_g23287 [Phytophthora cactorum]KAG2793134.1 hypothetical protein PC112_g23575 [Phytophthora cactorum]KAG2877277.1 hypothetical protein PC115_g23400 [Phytophthora cactorum]KAG2882893.1 hypothetical protein PC117_g26142 [Phytophthora cactorum]
MASHALRHAMPLSTVAAKPILGCGVAVSLVHKLLVDRSKA